MQYRNPPSLLGAVVKDVAEVAVGVDRSNFGAAHPKGPVACSTTLSGARGAVKLGQPQPLSNFLVEANRGSPDTMST